MGAIDLSSVFVPKIVFDLNTDVSMIKNVSDKLSKLNNLVQILEDELREINFYKHEVPLCKHLLNDAIKRLKEEAMHCTEASGGQVMKEFIPLKCNWTEEKMTEKQGDCEDKKNWMSTAQLWSTSVHFENGDVNKQDCIMVDLKWINKKESTKEKNPYPLLCNIKNWVGEYAPCKEQSTMQLMKEENENSSIHGISISNSVTKMDSIDLNLKGDYNPISFDSSYTTLQQRQQRKERRRWSPELHRRFVNAIHQLGGPHAATPKKIRELMKIGGLTNDEVKSHLQKYRLHVRELPVSSTAPTNGFLMGQNQYGNLSKAWTSFAKAFE